MSDIPLSRHPGRLSFDQFTGRSQIGEWHYINGRDDEGYGHVWEAAEEGDGLGPILWSGSAEQSGYAVRVLESWEPAGTAILLAPDGNACGFYMGGNCWIDEDHRGKGLSSPLIVTASYFVGGSPTRNKDGVLGFSEAGYAAHKSAWRVMREDYLSAVKAAPPQENSKVAEGEWCDSLDFDPGSLTLEEFMGPVGEISDEHVINGHDHETDEWAWDVDIDDLETIWRGAGNCVGYEVRELWDYFDSGHGVLLVDPDGESCGYYIEGRCWIDDDHRGKGLSVPMILAEARRLEGSPRANAESRDFSPAGHRAHAKAWEVAKADFDRRMDNVGATHAP
jgi:GNAT superfamily N-acetyltransferase